MITIWRASLDDFWSQEPGTVRVNLTILRKVRITTKEELGLEGLFPPLGTYMLKGEMGMGVECVTLRLSLRKGIYVGHIQWGRMGKSKTVWANIYGSGVLEMGDTIFAKGQ